MSDEDITDGSGTSRLNGGLIAVAIVAVVLIVFGVQNTDSTQVTWLFFDNEAPLWLVIVIAAVAGALLTEVAGWVIRRRRRN